LVQTPAARSEDHLVFRVGEGLYAVDTRRVREVVRAAPVTPLPPSNRTASGLFNLRGSAVPVLSREALFDELPDGVAPLRFLIVELAGGLAALPVDEVFEITALSVEPADAVGGEHMRLLLGLAQWKGAPIGILDLDKAA
jgi:purine-binding chemotaxis protein CheW